jgi:hypothetical protein
MTFSSGCSFASATTRLDSSASREMGFSIRECCRSQYGDNAACGTRHATHAKGQGTTPVVFLYSPCQLGST